MRIPWPLRPGVGVARLCGAVRPVAKPSREREKLCTHTYDTMAPRLAMKCIHSSHAKVVTPWLWWLCSREHRNWPKKGVTHHGDTGTSSTDCCDYLQPDQG